MNQEQIDILNTTQEVFRGLLVAIMASSKQPLDIEILATSLQAWSANEALSPMARTMLANLAEFPQHIYSTNNPPH
jgi:hypothetical protein